MTVRELKEILNEVDEERVVICDSFYNSEVNGYYLTTNNDEAVVVLSNLNVQPRN